jgi:hypothetical protein
VCVLGELLSTGQERHFAARFASGDILSLLDANDQELPNRNQIIQEIFGLCYPNNGQLQKTLLDAYTKQGRKGHGYWKDASSDTTSPFGFLPSGTKFISKENASSGYCRKHGSLLVLN